MANNTLRCSAPDCNTAVGVGSSGLCAAHRIKKWKMERCGVCCIEGCDRVARGIKHGLCETHYYRLRRTGTSDATKRVVVEGKPQKLGEVSAITIHSAGYRKRWAPEHPEAIRTGQKRVYEHRMVLYDKIGAGPHDCHWCGSKFPWEQVQPDHLDENKSNNAPDNLVPSCWPCNRERGRAKNIAVTKARASTTTAFGQTKTNADWARQLGMSLQAFMNRIKAGWPPEKIVSQPPKRRNSPNSGG